MIRLCLLLAAVVPIPAVAGPCQPDSTRVLAATGAFFALSVADIAASARWYSEKLGLQVVMQAPKQGNAEATVLQGGGLTVELIQHDDARPLRVAAPDAKGALFVHGVFKVGVVVENYAEALATLRARQVEIAMGPFPARGDQPANLIIKDNAGNLIQILAK